MTMLPASTDFTGATKTEAEFKTAITALRTFLFEKLGDDGSVAVQAFASGTKMLFQQTAAPTGWTKDTTHNDKALRVVSGTASSGGTTAFSTIFAKTTTDAHTLTAADVPNPQLQTYRYTVSVGEGGWMGIELGNATAAGFTPAWANVSNWSTSSALGNLKTTNLGGSHTHGMDIRVQYVDLIIATKN
jgi:hypothetical protein